MRPAKVTCMRFSRDCLGHLGAGKASESLATSILYASTPSSFRLVADTQSVFACSHACLLLSFHVFPSFLVGTWQRKKTSFGLAASARRKRKILALGKNLMASSSLMRWRVLLFWPLMGTLTKQSSADQYVVSSGCKRTKSFACEML